MGKQTALLTPENEKYFLSEKMIRKFRFNDEILTENHISFLALREKKADVGWQSFDDHM